MYTIKLKAPLSIAWSILVMLTVMPSCFSMITKNQKTIKSTEAAEPSSADTHNSHTNKPLIYIIVGSTRTTDTGPHIAATINSVLKKRTDITTEIIKITDYNLPFYIDPIAPASRKEKITDPVLKKWSDKIKQADGYIIISPVYNSGYPAPLKNALDCLYVEWNYKPVAFIGYSGGASGGASMITQLRSVALELKMIPVSQDITIPYSWKAFDNNGNLQNLDTVEKELNIIINQLLASRKKQ